MGKNRKEEKNKHFNNRKEFVTWLIGVIIFYAISIGMIIWAYYDKKAGGEKYDAAMVIGVLFILAMTAIIIGDFFGAELAAMLFGIVLILIGLVLPIVSGYYPVVIVTFLIWFSGFLIILDGFAKLTKTTDKKYYKVIFGAARKLSDGIFNGITGKKKSKTQVVVEKSTDIISKTIRFVIKAFGVLVVLLLVGIGVFAFYKGAVMVGVIMFGCALFFLVCYKVIRI